MVCLLALSARITLFLITSRRFCCPPMAAPFPAAAYAIALLALSLSTSELVLIWTWGFEPSDDCAVSNLASSFSQRYNTFAFSTLCLSNSSRLSLSWFSSSRTSTSCSFFSLSSSFSNSDFLNEACLYKLSVSFCIWLISWRASSALFLWLYFSFSFYSLAIRIVSISVSRFSKSSLCFNISCRFSLIKESTYTRVSSNSCSTPFFSFCRASLSTKRVSDYRLYWVILLLATSRHFWRNST